MGCIYIQNESSIDTVRFIAKADDDIIQSISLYHDNGKYYAFLPSYADFDSLSIEYSTKYSLYLDGEHYKSNSSFSKIQTDKEYSIELKNGFGMPVCKEKLIIMKADNIAALSIHLINGTIDNINADKEISKTGLATLIKANKKVDYAGSIKKIHGRGNSTWGQEKKSYTLELPEETDLLGMGAGKSWVLLSNSFDESGLRNKLVYDAAKEIGVKFAVDSEYVDLYVDSVYYGLYLLCERVDVGKNRVEITDLEEKTKSVNQYPLSNYHQFEEETDGKMKRGFKISNNPTDITGGYLVQIEHHGGRIENKESLFQTDTLSFSVSSPKYASQKQIDYLYNYFNTVESKIIEGDLSDIDLDSFVDYYLIQELFANKDISSVYFCKDSDLIDSKVYACSIWDFDLSIGNSWLYSNTNPSVLYRNTGNWFDYLYDNSTFKASLQEKYTNIIKPKLNTIIYSKLEEYGNTINSSFAMDKIRWGYIINAWSDQSQNRFDTLDEHINYIVDFMNQRIKFLDSAWIDGVDYRFVGFFTPERKDYYSVRLGESFTDEPNPECDAANNGEFLGWYDDDGNKYVSGKVITQNETYTAKWEKMGDDTGALLSLINRVKANPMHEKIFIAGGLIFIGCAIIFFVIVDTRNTMKSWRYPNGHKH